MQMVLRSKRGYDKFGLLLAYDPRLRSGFKALSKDRELNQA